MGKDNWCENNFCHTISHQYIPQNAIICQNSKIGYIARNPTVSGVSHHVPGAGLEPARPIEQQILSLQCLPIPPPRQLKLMFKNLEASAGFEPANNGFANRSLKPLGYDAIIIKNYIINLQNEMIVSI